MGLLKQWVNVPKEERFLGSGESIERLGPDASFVCEFKNEAPTSFKYKLSLEGAELYSEDELKHVPEFKVLRGQGQRTNEGESKIVLDVPVRLPPGGGLRYGLRARCGEEKARSKDQLETWRRFYVQPMAMEGVTPGDLQPVIDALKDEANKYCLELVEKEAGQTIPFKKTLKKEDFPKVLREVKAKYRLANLDPNAFVLLWVGWMADPEDFRLDYTWDSTKGGSDPLPFTFDKAQKTLELNLGKDLWFGFDDADDEKRSWLQYWEGKITLAGEPPREVMFSAKGDNVAISGEKRKALGGYRKIKIDLASAIGDEPAGDALALEFRLAARIVTGATPGLRHSLHNVIFVSDKAGLEEMPAAMKPVVAMHEVGHLLGMVPERSGWTGWRVEPEAKTQKRPMQPSGFYKERGHSGPHCQAGMTYTERPPKGAEPWTGTPGCVMFGGYHGSLPISFCGPCATTVRKLWLGPTINALRCSITKFGT